MKVGRVTIFVLIYFKDNFLPIIFLEAQYCCQFSHILDMPKMSKLSSFSYSVTGWMHCHSAPPFHSFFFKSELLRSYCVMGSILWKECFLSFHELTAKKEIKWLPFTWRKMFHPGSWNFSSVENYCGTGNQIPLTGWNWDETHTQNTRTRKDWQAQRVKKVCEDGAHSAKRNVQTLS